MAEKPILSHFNERGEARMVDVGLKPPTQRAATALAEIKISPVLLGMIRSGTLPKGDPLAVARVAGIMAAKKTPELIPLCHPLPLDAVEMDVSLGKDRVMIMSTVRCQARTGAEMEALTAVSVAALAFYDMCKSADRSMTIGPVRLERKSGGASGSFERSGSRRRPI